MTPMMQQYLLVKKEYSDCILFFRLGDFYEMFFEDAELASRELEITLTGRDCGLDRRAPMCGVPYHSAVGYIARLIQKGYKVAICEQVEDPSLTKGIVKREVTRVITPGTVIDQSMLDDKSNNYIMTVYSGEQGYGIAYADISTGQMSATSIPGDDRDGVFNEIAKIGPKEILVNDKLFMETSLVRLIESGLGLCVTRRPEVDFGNRAAYDKIKSHFRVNSLEGLGLEDRPLCVSAVGAILKYLDETQKVDLIHINSIDIYSTSDYMLLDASTRRNLELVETIRTKERKGSLLWMLDKTQTAMGGRMLRRWIEQPLINPVEINKRLDGVEELKNDILLLGKVKEQLSRVYDLERLLGRIAVGTANARDLVALKQSLKVLPGIKESLALCKSQILSEIRDRMDPLQDVQRRIEASIHPDPPVSIKEGGIIRDGYDQRIDDFRRASRDGRQWIASLESKEREATGIKSLKVGFNKVFGYYIEVTRSNLAQVPDSYIRKQTLVNAERFITPELKEMESTILGAQEKLVDLEYQVFIGIRDSITAEADRIKTTSHCISVLDALYSMARVASENGYVRPLVDFGQLIEIKDGRHPVVEKSLGINRFVPNDTRLDCDHNRLCIITGPNMAGKSTYMRQVALIVLMAQAGSFVPASSCRIGVADRIFTRVGASDDLASGQSTFMVEMSEVANILNNATARSLIILDEIGRGTSTFDGLSIAWAVTEYIADKGNIGARTLFATHYHQLTELEGKLEGVKNYCIAVKEKGDDIIFLRKVIRGGADRSYGIQVAGLAGLPREVIDRAREILNNLEEADTTARDNRTDNSRGLGSVGEYIDLFNYKYLQLIEEVSSVDIDSMTPLEALNRLSILSKKAGRLVGDTNAKQHKNIGQGSIR
jgi:DNA mismatch repair protein MutS